MNVKLSFLTHFLAIVLLLLTLTACQTNHTSYTDPEGNVYKYKLELTGALPNATHESTYIILTNDKSLTFDKVAKSMYSSYRQDSIGKVFYLLSIE